MRECESCGRCLDDGALPCCGTGGLLTETFPGPPLVDGKYLLERRLGAGGMGSVYRALHVGLGKVFAVKVIRSLLSAAPQAVARFRIEAQALGRLSHPNVVAVTDYGVDPRGGGLPYLVMEHLPGESLLGHVERQGPISPEDAVRLLGPIAAALDHAHREGILHRDLKPSNVFLAVSEDGSLVPKLLDFGLARFAGMGPDSPLPEVAAAASGGPEPPTVPLSRRPGAAPPSAGAGLPTVLTAAEGIVGTPQFFAPELIEGSAPSRRTDLWAFGVLAYTAVTGTLPWQGPVPGVLAAIVDTPPDPPSRRSPALDPKLDAALLAPLARDPSRRPESATAWIATLDDAVRALAASRARAREAPRRLLLAAAIALVATAAAVAAAGLRPFAAADGVLLDARFRVAPRRTPDPRILLVSIDEAALGADSSPLSSRGDEAGALLEAAFAAGARGAALDLLVPPDWSAAPAFARAVVSRPDRIALAALSGDGGLVVGPEALAGPVALSLGERAPSLFGFANLSPDGDGTVRRARTAFLSAEGEPVPSFAARAASLLGWRAETGSRPFLVDYRIDRSAFRRLSFPGARGALEKEPARARGRLLVLGAEFEGSGDLHPDPHDRALSMTGLELQALAIQTLLEGEPLREASRQDRAFLVLPLLFVAAFAALWLPGRAAGLTVLAAALLVPPATALAAFLARGLVLPVAAPVAAVAVAGGVALLGRSRLPSLPTAPRRLPR